MADVNFIVKNGLTVNTNFVVNSSSLSYSGNSTLNGTNTVINSNTTFNGNNSYFNGNIIITAGKGINANGSLGSQGQALLSNGSSIYWATATAGSNTHVQFNDSGTANASSGFVFNKVTNNVTIANSLTVSSMTVNSISANSATVSIGTGVTAMETSGNYAIRAYANSSDTRAIVQFTNNGQNSQTGMIQANSTMMYMNGGSGVYLESVGIGVAPSGTGGELRATGDITSSYSDDRLKDIIGPIPNSLEKVKALTGFYYTPNKTAINLGIDQNQLSKVGVSAQQVREVLPEAVKDAPIGQGYLTVQYEKIIPLLIEAIKELETKVNNRCKNCSCGGN